MPLSQHEKERAQAFAKEHWPIITAGTLAGAAILLLIKYFRDRKKELGDTTSDGDLNVYEGEAKYGTDKTAVLLETGAAICRDIPDVTELTAALAQGLEGADRDVMETLGGVSK